jgi:hypothetical protein
MFHNFEEKENLLTKYLIKKKQIAPNAIIIKEKC